MCVVNNLRKHNPHCIIFIMQNGGLVKGSSYPHFVYQTLAVHHTYFWLSGTFCVTSKYALNIQHKLRSFSVAMQVSKEFLC